VLEDRRRLVTLGVENAEVALAQIRAKGIDVEPLRLHSQLAREPRAPERAI